MTSSLKSELAEIARLHPQEKPLKTRTRNESLQIAVAKEAAFQERRVALKPESVAVLVQHGHEVIVESKAGTNAHFSDNEYSEAGAFIEQNREKVFQSQIVLKVEPPTFEEIEMTKPGITMVSAFQSGGQSIEFLQALNKKRLTAIGYEFVEDKVGGLPLVRAMSEIAGSTVLLIAAEYLSSAHDGQGVILGGITGVPPTKVVIIGAGTVAEYAARSAIGLGVDIQVFDDHIHKLRRLKHAIGQQIHTSTINSAAIARAVKEADVVIGAMRIERGRVKYIVTEEMVADMKPGSIIIDVTVDQGGCVETSQITNYRNPIFRKYDVIHYCVPNIASRVARTASVAISNILTPILLQISESGGLEDMLFKHRWFMKGVYTYKGSLTNLDLAKRYNLGYKDLSLLMAARI